MFFLKLSPSAWAKTQTARACVFTPRSANSTTRPRSVNADPRMRARSQSAISPERARFLWPPILPGATLPVRRFRAHHFETHDGLTANAAATERIVSPFSTRAKARSRRLFD